MYLAQSSDRLLHDAPWMKKPWGCADKLLQMFRCSTSKNLNYRWPRSFVVDLCDFPSCLRQEWKLNVDGVCHVAVLLTLLAFRFYWCVTWRSGQVLGKEGGRKEQKEKDKTAKLKAKLPCRHCMSPSHNRGIAHPGDPRLVAGACLRGGRSPHHALGRASYNFHLFSCTWSQDMQNVSKCYNNVQQ